MIIAPEEYIVIQIGFNKAGTTSLANLFSQSNYPSCHGFCSIDNGTNIGPIGRLFFNEYKENKNISLIPNFRYYGDFGVFLQEKQVHDIKFVNPSYHEIINSKHRTWYQVFDELYGNRILYLLNMRDINHWIKSRYFHHWKGHNLIEPAKEAMHFYWKEHTVKDVKILKLWRNLWYQYICNLLKYFKDNNMEQRLLIFDIEQDDINKLILFFNKFDINLNKLFMINDNHNTNKKHPKMYSVWLSRWNDIIERDSTFAVNYTNNDPFDNEYERVVHVCEVIASKNMSVSDYFSL